MPQEMIPKAQQNLEHRAQVKSKLQEMHPGTQKAAQREEKNRFFLHSSADSFPPYDQHEEAGSVLVEGRPGEPPLHGVHALAGQVRVDLHGEPWGGRPTGEAWL